MRLEQGKKMVIESIRTPLFREGDDLIRFVTKHIRTVSEGDAIAITSKIVSLSEGQTASIRSFETKTALIKSESAWALKTKYAWLTLKDGMFAVAAGIDESNAHGRLILLPKDSFASARKIRTALMRFYGVKKLGILITDSRTLPLRAGAVGLAVGYAGFRGIRDYRGKRDLSGRMMKFTQANIADSLAASAVLAMGEGAESTPIARIRGASLTFVSHVSKGEVRIPLVKDLYAPLFRSVIKRTPN